MPGIRRAYSYLCFCEAAAICGAAWLWRLPHGGSLKAFNDTVECEHKLMGLYARGT